MYTYRKEHIITNTQHSAGRTRKKLTYHVPGMTGCTHQLHHVLKMWKHFSTSAGQPATKPFQVATGFETPPPARNWSSESRFSCFSFDVENICCQMLGLSFLKAKLEWILGVYTLDLYTTNYNLVCVCTLGCILGMLPYPVAITTRIITWVIVGVPCKGSLATATGRGSIPKCICSYTWTRCSSVPTKCNDFGQLP